MEMEARLKVEDEKKKGVNGPVLAGVSGVGKKKKFQTGEERRQLRRKNKN